MFLGLGYAAAEQIEFIESIEDCLTVCEYVCQLGWLTCSLAAAAVHACIHPMTAQRPSQLGVKRTRRRMTSQFIFYLFRFFFSFPFLLSLFCRDWVKACKKNAWIQTMTTCSLLHTHYSLRYQWHPSLPPCRRIWRKETNHLIVSC